MAALFYDLISSTLHESKVDQIVANLWRCKIPLKICCFTWLAVGNRIMTSDNLLKHGWVGPGVCILCRFGEDLVQHIFIECPFSRWALISLCERFCVPPPMDCTLSLFLEHWFIKHTIHSVHSYIPIFVFWSVWKMRNRCIFDGKKDSMLGIIH